MSKDSAIVEGNSGPKIRRFLARVVYWLWDLIPEDSTWRKLAPQAMCHKKRWPAKPLARLYKKLTK